METSELGAATSGLDAAISALSRSFRGYRRRVSSNIRVGITLQMCNRVTNHGDIGTFSKPEAKLNPIPKSIRFLDNLNLGALFDVFLGSMC